MEWAVDLVHLVEEVEDFGTAARNAVRSQSERITEHALKLAYSRAAKPRPGWMNSIDDAPGRIEDTITATIRRDVEAALPRLFERAHRNVEGELLAYGERQMAAALPRPCPLHARRPARGRAAIPKTGTGSTSP